MIIALKTDAPTATIALVRDNGEIAARYEWEAHRTLARDLLKKIQEQLALQQSDWRDVTGLIVFGGPGSFTGLRIGAAVANAIAHSEKVPIVGTKGQDWLKSGLQKILAGVNDQVVLPEYGAEARITKPRK